MSTPAITFTDADDTWTLVNGMPGAAARFCAWTPMQRPVGATARRLSDEKLMMFATSTRYAAAFELRNIRLGEVSDQRNVEVAARLVAHLLGGGTCSVDTGDADDTVYATCGLAPDAEPSLALADPQTGDYTLTLALINLAATPVAMVCRYL